LQSLRFHPSASREIICFATGGSSQPMRFSFCFTENAERIPFRRLCHTARLGLRLTNQLFGCDPRVGTKMFGVLARRTALALGLAHRLGAPPGGIAGRPVSHTFGGFAGRFKHMRDLRTDGRKLRLEVTVGEFAQTTRQTVALRRQIAKGGRNRSKELLDFGGVVTAKGLTEIPAGHLFRGQLVHESSKIPTVSNEPHPAGWPKDVVVREVGPRDGFQNEPEIIATADKVRLIQALALAGFTRMEVTSFVRAEVIPQLADAREVLNQIELPSNLVASVLVPNERGLNEALELRDHFGAVGIFISASDTHNQKNVNRSRVESMEANLRMIPRILAEELLCEAIIATSFGCPYEGEVKADVVLSIAEQFAEAGVHEVGFGDTTGMANPRQVEDFFDRAIGALSGVELTAHFHNTRGQGLANAVAALRAGCRSFESSFGELGGCPVPVGSTGNIATEDLVSMFEEMGIETGLDLVAIIEAAQLAQSILGRKLGSHTLVAGPIDWVSPTRRRIIND
jgi:hydroxymethylglutaryl-CoA lyase